MTSRLWYVLLGVATLQLVSAVPTFHYLLNHPILNPHNFFRLKHEFLQRHFPEKLLLFDIFHGQHYRPPLYRPMFPMPPMNFPVPHPGVIRPEVRPPSFMNPGPQPGLTDPGQWLVPIPPVRPPAPYLPPVKFPEFGTPTTPSQFETNENEASTTAPGVVVIEENNVPVVVPDPVSSTPAAEDAKQTSTVAAPVKTVEDNSVLPSEEGIRENEIAGLQEAVVPESSVEVLPENGDQYGQETISKSETDLKRQDDVSPTTELVISFRTAQEENGNFPTNDDKEEPETVTEKQDRPLIDLGTKLDSTTQPIADLRASQEEKIADKEPETVTEIPEKEERNTPQEVASLRQITNKEETDSDANDQSEISRTETNSHGPTEQSREETTESLTEMDVTVPDEEDTTRVTDRSSVNGENKAE